MIDPFQIATMGVGPGWTPFTFATNGFGFDVEIIIRPIEGGGGYVGTAWDVAKPYEIVVIVKYKGKTWTQRRSISQLMTKSMEKVLATYKRITTHEFKIIANFKTAIKKNVFVKVRNDK